jgi:PAP2 superfamily protein
MRTSLSLPLGAIALALLGCSSQPEAPSADRTVGPSSLVGGAPKFWETGAAVRWNEMIDRLAARRLIPVNPRAFTYLSLAQFRAAQAAEAGTNPHPPVSAAIGGASVAVLSAFFPLDVAELEATLDAQEASDPWPGDQHENFAAGEAIGRGIGARVLAFAATDGTGLAPLGPPPVGPGYWVSSGAPIARGVYGSRPFFLSSGSEFRPGPPPAFGSPEFLAALAEVRHFSDTRTPEQLAIAIYWHVNIHPTSFAAFDGLARELITQYRLGDTQAARTFFLMHAATFDALVACGDAKFTYWFIRPSQADPGITLAVPLPNHPSYPSNHACVDGAVEGVLSAAFPSERSRIHDISEEGAISRLYAGIHYRFDAEAGLALGRAVAAKALAADLDQVAPLP